MAAQAEAAREGSTMSHTIRPLDASTWDAFAELVERNNGIFGGCWCIGYHPECGQKGHRGGPSTACLLYTSPSPRDS